ncbi:MAG: heavy metal translocating P-type ATPase metal-binding domain-containing protein [Ignavibacteria bacterium]|nr:heavy metal translocating P-type ATPase metal-binding domain-containing protein [Ignavibacteria bacterium]
MIKAKSNVVCYHCGEDCQDDSISADDKTFCCAGCKTVYEILNGNDLCSYYSFEENKGVSVREIRDSSKYDYLDDTGIQKRLIDFTNKNISTISFFIPSIHCTSCIWLLEKLYKVNTGIISSKVNFPEKKIRITFDNSAISLKELVKTLTSIGYEPLISPDFQNNSIKKSKYQKKLYLKIGIAGFCLGNIMLLSFPEYLSMDSFIEDNIKTLFNYLNLLLSVPVFFYCASDYFTSAWNGLKKKFINIDVPVSLGLTALFVRSIYEIIYFNNAGFSDSLAGLVFLLLLGKLFQNKTYDTLNFERDYRSYFPISVTLKTDNAEKSIPVSNLKPRQNNNTE